MRDRFIYGQDAKMAKWAAVQIGAGGGFPRDVRAIGVQRNGNLIAVALWHTLSLRNCFVSIATNRSGRCATREFLFRSFAYPFLQLDLPRVTCIVDEGNDESVRLAEHLGFKLEGRLRRAAPDGRDDLMFGMLREECRWIGLDMARHAA
jgi:hypothetical protein